MAFSGSGRSVSSTVTAQSPRPLLVMFSMFSPSPEMIAEMRLTMPGALAWIT